MKSKAAFHAELAYFGCFPEPGVNDRCPCGSIKKFKKCVHESGTYGVAA